MTICDLIIAGMNLKILNKLVSVAHYFVSFLTFFVLIFLCQFYFAWSQPLQASKPCAQMLVPPGAIAMDGAANATSRNTINILLLRATNVIIWQSHVCSKKGPFISEFDETVSLVYVTNLNDHLGVLKDAESHHHWTNFSSIWISSSMPPCKKTYQWHIACWYAGTQSM